MTGTRMNRDMTPIVSSFEDPSPEEIVITYWRDRAHAAHARAINTLHDYDMLTLQLEHAYGPTWRGKLSKKLRKWESNRERELMAEESHGERL